MSVSFISSPYHDTEKSPVDLLDATKAAVRYIIDTLVAEKGLTRIEAYFLCSVAGDLRLHEVVDMPNYVVGMMMPLSIFGHTPASSS